MSFTPEQMRELVAMRRELLWLKVQIAALRFRHALARKYSADQPRVPAGNPDGGQWASGGGSGRVRLAQGDRIQGYAVDLRAEEARGGHTIREHVAKPSEYLLTRVRREQSDTAAQRNRAEGLRVGSFASLDSATRLVNSTLARNRLIVDQVANGTLPGGRMTSRFEGVTGYEAYAATERSQAYMRETRGVFVRILRDPTSDRGYRVLTAYPVNIDR